MRQALSRLALLFAMGFGPFLLTPTQAAFAVGCPTSNHWDQFGDVWTPSDNEIGGVRAAMVFRHTGLVCNTGTSFSQISYWIGVEDANAIAQIGYTKEYDWITGTAQYTKVWAIGDGSDYHLYDFSLTDGETNLFKVVKYKDANNVYRFEIDDCGSSDYSSCATKNAQQSLGSGSQGEGISETNYGGTACTNKVMGNSSYRARIGTSSNPWQIQANYGGSWGVKSSFAVPQPVCTNYHFDWYTDGIILTWDDRN